MTEINVKEIDLDLERINAPLSYREVIMIRILIAIFTIIAPSKYNHQVKELFAKMFEK